MTTVTKTKATPIASAEAQSTAVSTLVDGLKSKAEDSITSIVKPLQEQAELASAKLLQGYSELQQLHLENTEALIESSTSAARGAELLAQELNTTAKASLERSINNSRAFLSARSLREVVELQTSFATATLQAALTNASRLQELSTRISGDVVAPLQARLTANMSRFGNQAGR